MVRKCELLEVVEEKVPQSSRRPLGRPGGERAADERENALEQGQTHKPQSDQDQRARRRPPGQNDIQEALQPEVHPCACEGAHAETQTCKQV